MASREVWTDKTIQAIKPIRVRQQKWVPGTQNLWLVVQPTGVKSWAWRGRLRGKPTKLTLGRYPAYSLADAAAWARSINEERRGGIDPLERQAAEKAEAERKAAEAADTVERVFKLYMEAEGNKRRTSTEKQRIFDREVKPVLGDRPIREVTRRELLQLVDVKAATAPIMANRLVAFLSRFFRWAFSRDYLEVNPCLGLKKPVGERTRDRVLSDDEIRWLWQATEKEPELWRDAFRLLLLTGQRRQEVFGMLRDEVNVAAAKPVWTLPAARTKTNKLHNVPLSPMAVSCVQARLKGHNKRHLFASRLSDDRPASGFSKAQARIQAEMQKIAEREMPGHKIPPWTAHDLRRTLATGLALLKIPEAVSQKVQNHSSGPISGVRAIYNRYGFEDEKRAALNAWGARVAKIVARRKGR